MADQVNLEAPRASGSNADELGHDLETSGSTSVDRRRPGRTAIVNPHLVSLLRNVDLAARATDEKLLDPTDELRIAKGLASALALSVPMWALLVWAVRLALAS